MSGILEKLGMNVRNPDVHQDLHLECIRFRRFIENLGNIIHLIEDAKDKLREEYIFDRHYVLCLADRVLEELSMMALNGSVLSPSAGSTLFLQMDAHRKFAQDTFLKADILRAESFCIPTSCRDSEQEILWLQAVLNWLAGPLPENRPSVTDWIRNAMDTVIADCRMEELVRHEIKNARNVPVSECESLKLIDIGGTAALSGGQSPSSEDIQCRPLGLLFLGLLDTTAPEKIPAQKPGADCWAVYDEDDISLQIRRHDRYIRLESSFSGNNASDYVFAYSQGSFDLAHICPCASWVETTGTGTVAWIDDIPSDQLEQQLIQLGSALLRQA